MERLEFGRCLVMFLRVSVRVIYSSYRQVLLKNWMVFRLMLVEKLMLLLKNTVANLQ